MPTIEISKKDLKKLTGMRITQEKLSLAKAEMITSRQAGISISEDMLKLEMADTNRPDLWSTEGIAREIKGKFMQIKTTSSGSKVIVDKNLKNIRPKTVCAVVRNVKLSEDSLAQLIQLQEKICETFGRKRKQAAIGVYDFDKIKFPITYKAFKPTEISFTPLDMKKALNLNQILEQHPKGKEYAHLLKGKSKYPIFIDSNTQVLSMPPIINSDYTGKVTTRTRNLFIECSGFEMKFLEPALNSLVYALAQRGGKIQTIRIKYPDTNIITPNLTPKKAVLDIDYVNNLSGLNLNKQQIMSILNKSNYKIKSQAKNKLTLLYPSYRQDIMHQADIIEDIIIRYGYNKIKSITPQIATTGKLLLIQGFQHKISELAIGLGAQEILSYTLTNKDALFKKMNTKPSQVIEIDNPISKNWSIFRTWIIPCLMEFLGRNTRREYPQKIFEIGQVVILDKEAETRSRNPIHLAYAEACKDTDFTKAKQALDFMMDNLGIKYKIHETIHHSFIQGRVGRVIVKNKPVAYIGEIHPQVLVNLGIQMPVSVFELNLTDLFELINQKPIHKNNKLNSQE